MEINLLRQKIFNRPRRIKQIHLVWLCLNFVKEHPEHLTTIGIGWIDNKHFIFNCLIFAHFSNRIPNSINSYFKKHGFKCHQTTKELRRRYIGFFEDCSYSSCWVIRNCDGFNQSTTESELVKFKYINTNKKKQIKKEKNEENQQIIRKQDNEKKELKSNMQFNISDFFDCNDDDGDMMINSEFDDYDS